MGMGEHGGNRSTQRRTRRPLSHPAELPPPARPAWKGEKPADEQEEQGLTVLPPIVWTAGIAGVVAVLLLSA
jgi:hypothetical protein